MLVLVTVAAGRPVLVVMIAVLITAVMLLPMMVVAVTMAVVIVRVVMAVAMMTVAVMVVRADVLLAALGLERARDRADAAALAARQLGDRGIDLDIDRVAVELGRNMRPAEMPGEAHEPCRIFRTDLEELLRRRPHLHEAAVLELHRVAVVERRGAVEVELELEPAMGPQRELAALTGVVVEPGRIGNPVGLDGGFADDGGGAQHEVSDIVVAACYHEPVFPIEAQGSCGGLAPPFCSSSIEMPSGERMKAMWPSRGGRLMVTPPACSRAQVA
jgi:hypothetical protein